MVMTLLVHIYHILHDTGLPHYNTPHCNTDFNKTRSFLGSKMVIFLLFLCKYPHYNTVSLITRSYSSMSKLRAQIEKLDRSMSKLRAQIEKLDPSMSKLRAQIEKLDRSISKLRS